ncbi:MAG: 30S ribosomal protein S5 [Candidatus Gracilibacteria bacterium]|nr:30S ribosomal protein S5 [Candidatus Gracilibacteria bacterium]
MPKKPRRKPQREQSEFKEVVLKIDRVNRVVKGGRRLRFRATVAIGNQKGLVGLGIGKSEEVANAVKKAVSKAKKSLMRIQLVDDTIAHQVYARFKGSEIMILPARQGTGIIAGGALRSIAELVGLKNILSKSHGSNNRINAAKAALLALSKLKVVEIKEKKEELKTEEIKKAETPKTPAKKAVVKEEKAKQTPAPKTTKTAKPNKS